MQEVAAGSSVATGGAGGALKRPPVWTCQAAGGRNKMPRKSEAERNIRTRARPCFASKAHRHQVPVETKLRAAE